MAFKLHVGSALQEWRPLLCLADSGLVSFARWMLLGTFVAYSFSSGAVVEVALVSTLSDMEVCGQLLWLLGLHLAFLLMWRECCKRYLSSPRLSDMDSFANHVVADMVNVPLDPLPFVADVAPMASFMLSGWLCDALRLLHSPFPGSVALAMEAALTVMIYVVVLLAVMLIREMLWLRPVCKLNSRSCAEGPRCCRHDSSPSRSVLKCPKSPLLGRVADSGHDDLDVAVS
ncbi:hypothetical protein Nepgr_018799 [Nepenthes gracilis]|uniref:Uncharacterized protein n=1 Tax=Nepenthes gracilis TaxID=150966 RepID=A0AAD3SSU4_NEPGR|nr:hypothetical protein Nepgr_018799 [Nepenthes gracilis]